MLLRVKCPAWSAGREDPRCPGRIAAPRTDRDGGQLTDRLVHDWEANKRRSHPHDHRIDVPMGGIFRAFRYIDALGRPGQTGSRTKTGIWRVVRCWYSAYGG